MHNSRFTIRRAVAGDAAAIAAIYNEAIRTTTATFDTEEKSAEDRLRWLEDHDETHPVYVAEVEGVVAGYASLTRWSDRQAYAGTVESSFYVAERFRGQGVGRELKRNVVEEAKRLGYHTLLARVAEGSEASMHLNIAFGFQHVGTMKEVGHKFGRWLDVHILQLMLDDDTPNG
jgi:phosphinothricin acetyltransferase